MGYMGLSHWAESDNAAGFRYTIMEALKQKKGGRAKAQRLIRKEMKLTCNQWNTDGPVNVALVMEDAGGKNHDGPTPDIAKLMTKVDFETLIKGLQKLIKECGPEDMADGNANWHRENYERLLKFVKGKASKL
jgi:hypothetical protein